MNTRLVETESVTKRHGIPLATMTIANEIIPLLHKEGHDIYAIAEAANFPLALIEDQYSHCCEQTWYQLLAAVGQHIGTLGLKTLFQQLAKDLLIPRYLPGKARSLNSTLADVLSICSGSSAYNQLEVRQLAGRLILVQGKRYGNISQQPHAEQAVIQCMTEIISMLTATDWQPSIIALQSSAISPDFKQCFSGSTIYLGRRLTAIDITDEIDIKNIEFLGSGFAGICQQQQQKKGFAANFKLVLKPYISTGRFAIHEAAQLLGICARTLQRRLKHEGTSYSQIVDDIMLEHIIKLMSKPEHSLTEIGLIMGYSDPAHFSRAFKKITGESPRGFRKNLASR